MKDYKKTFAITLLLMLVPIFIGFALWDQLPEQVATHFNTKGVADRYDSKLFTVIGIPLFMLAVQIVCIFTSKKNFEKAGSKMTALTLWLCPLISIFVMMSIYAKALNKEVNISFTAMILISFITIFIGNYLPKVKQNSTIGIRIPSTLRDEENWNRTHRFAGKLWVGTGFVILIMTFLKVNPLFVTMVWIAVVVVIPIVYSYAIEKK